MCPPKGKAAAAPKLFVSREEMQFNPWVVGGVVLVVGAGVWWYLHRTEKFSRTKFNEKVMSLARTASRLSTMGVGGLDTAIDRLPPQVGDVVGRNFSANKGRGGGLFGTLSGANGGIFARVANVFS